MKDYINYLLDTVNNILISKFLALLILYMKNCKINAQTDCSSTRLDKTQQNVVNRMQANPQNTLPSMNHSASEEI